MKLSVKIGQRLVLFAYLVQIALGLIWIAGNAGGTVPELCGLGGRLLLAFYAGYLFLRENMYRFYRGTCLSHIELVCILGAMGFICIPQCMQMHMTLPRESLGISSFLFIISLYLQLHELEYIEEEKKHKKSVLHLVLFILWFFLGVVKPLYAILSLYFVLSELWEVWKIPSRIDDHKRRRRVGLSVIFVLEAIVLLIGYRVSPLTLERNLAASSVSRFAYVNFEKDYDELPKDIHDALGLVNARKTAFSSDGVWTTLIPVLEEQFTYRETNNALWRVAALGAQKHGKENLKQILWDAAGYHLPGIVVPMQLNGRGYEALTGYNYYQLIRRTPKLGRFLLKLNLFFSMIFLISGIAGLLYVIVIGQKGIHLRRLYYAFLLTAEGIVIINSLYAGGRMDYRLSCLTTIFLYTPGILLMVLDVGEQRTGTKNKQK